MEKDVILGSIYIPPENSRHYRPDIFETLELEILSKRIEFDANFLLGGDFNARTATLNDFIDYDDTDYILGNNNNSTILTDSLRLRQSAMLFQIIMDGV